MMKCHRAGELTYFTFPALTEAGLKHTIGTRLGGVSPPPFHTLNMSVTVGDCPENVRENRARLGRVLGVRPEELVIAWLVHGCDVARVGYRHRGNRVPHHDALMTAEPGVPLFMTFADCVPVIVYDPVQKAVVLAHAGWRGTAQGITRNAIRALQVTYGSHPADILVALGPAIGPCHYEVGAEVVKAVQPRHTNPSPLIHEPRPGHTHLDLFTANRLQAQALGISQVLISPYCTACHTDLFYSHRAERGRTGRFGVLVML